MNNFRNSSKDAFLQSIPQASIEHQEDTLARRCKFNFSYFTVPENKKGFEVWSQSNLVNLIEKLRDYCRESLDHWQTVRVGKTGTILTLYGGFPRRSAFSAPSHVPHQARWGRFRLDWSGRLCGFVIPKSYSDTMHHCGHRFDCNTFYVVFIDDDHTFWQGGGEAK